MLNTVFILGIPISRLGFAEVMEACEQRLATSQGGYVCFANVHSVTESAEHPDLSQALSGAFLSVADGLPLVWTSRLRGKPIASRVCGPDFMTEFLRKHPGMRHGFLGGVPGRAEEIARRFGVDAVCYSPPMRPYAAANVQEDWEAFRALSGDKAPTVVWVGLGAPKQELWMRECSRLSPDTLFFGVGAAFDFLTGSKSRAPDWMQKSGLEWSYRLVQEPRRLWRRYAVTNSKFLMKECLELIGDRLGRSPR